MFKLTEIVKHLLIINILVYIGSQLITAQGVFDANEMLALHYPTSDLFRPWQIVTHFFMHDPNSLMHIFFNMFALVMFGPPVERIWGPKRFLFFYFFTALGAAALHTFATYLQLNPLEAAYNSFLAMPNADSFLAFMEHWPTIKKPEVASEVVALADNIRNGSAPAIKEASDLMVQYLQHKINIPIIGASGAIFGVLLAFGMFFPNAELMLIFFPVPIKAKYFIPGLMFIELFLGVYNFSWDNIAHFAHLGGALFGLILILYWRKRPLT